MEGVSILSVTGGVREEWAVKRQCLCRWVSLLTCGGTVENYDPPT